MKAMAISRAWQNQRLNESGDQGLLLVVGIRAAASLSWSLARFERLMPLPLTDPRWSKLHSSYEGTEDVVAWLAEAYEQGGLSDERLGDLINEVG